MLMVLIQTVASSFTTDQTTRVGGSWTENSRRTKEEEKVMPEIGCGLSALSLITCKTCLVDMGQYEISSSDDEMPFACYLCRETFRTPVVTK